MTQSISNRFTTSIFFALFGFVSLLPIHSGVVCAVCTQSNSAQTDSRTDSKSDPSESLESQAQVASLEVQTQLVRAVYDATKTARTVTDYTAFLKQCEEALAVGLDKKNHQYVSSLTGWAHNRRAEKRLALAEQLKKIGNSRYEDVRKEAMKDFDDAVLKGPERYRSWMARGVAYVNNGSYDLGIKDFTRVIQLKPDESNAWFNRAEALYQRSKIGYGENLKNDQLMVLEGGSPNEELILDEKIRAIGYEQAIRDYDAVLRLNSDDAEALTGRGHCNFALARFGDALVDYERVVDLDAKIGAKSDKALVNRADAFQSLGRWQAARDDYASALRIAKTPVALQRMAWFKATCPDANLRDAKTAKNMIDQAIATSGDSTLNLDTKAAVEAALGNFAEALSIQEDVVKQVIGLASAVVESGEVQGRLAMYNEGKPYVQKVNLAEVKEPVPTKVNQSDDQGNQGPAHK